MSRAFKDAMVDDYLDLGGSGLAVGGAVAETLSGADLEQLRMAARNNSGSVVAAAGANGATKDLSTNKAFTVLGTITADGVNTVTTSAADFANLFVGMVVNIRGSNLTTVRADGVTLTALNPATNTATYSGADQSAAISAGDVIIRSSGPVRQEALTGADLNRYAGQQ